nr:vegetative cell wall protein gp1-like [Aegilops tauschii subsp. strangulata]
MLNHREPEPAGHQPPPNLHRRAPKGISRQRPRPSQLRPSRATPRPAAAVLPGPGRTPPSPLTSRPRQRKEEPRPNLAEPHYLPPQQRRQTTAAPPPPTQPTRATARPRPRRPEIEEVRGRRPDVRAPVPLTPAAETGEARSDRDRLDPAAPRSALQQPPPHPQAEHHPRR